MVWDGNAQRYLSCLSVLWSNRLFWVFRLFGFLIFACEKLRKFAHRSINEWLYRNCDRCDRSMNQKWLKLYVYHATPPAPPLRAEWWVKQICKFAHIIKHYSHVFLSLCFFFFFFNLLFQWLAVFLKVNLIKNQIVHRMHHQCQRVLIRRETRRGPQKSFERVIEFCGKFGNCNLIFVSESHPG